MSLARSMVWELPFWGLASLLGFLELRVDDISEKVGCIGGGKDNRCDVEEVDWLRCARGVVVQSFIRASCERLLEAEQV